ncbi:acyl-CoA dehydrogenase family protein [Microbacterium gorillae]|uniref:acyl-CoA dehydrogenase family protein n=1 Tax=Microbacterium gorillae TaxID=1231063 RepID=UPI00058F69BE|nr:acyl-CoA dehydrogenase family protein [Microbacterium gorillae]
MSGLSPATLLAADEAIAKAERLAERVDARRDYSDEFRRLPEETIADFHDSGLLRINQAARWGGAELGNRAVVDVVSAISKGDAASGWVYGVIASHFWLGSLFTLEAQEDMWGDNPDAMMASSFAAQASECVAVDGGYRVSGRWPYSSGSLHCEWGMVGIVVPGADGQPPIKRWCLLPRSEYRVEDTWHTSALRGTGSNTIVIDDVFIPEYRTVDPALLMTNRAPGADVNPSLLFRLNFSEAITWYLAAVAVGAAERTVEDFAQHAAKKRSKFSTEVQISDSMLIHVGTASSQVDAARSVLSFRASSLDDLVAAGTLPDFREASKSNRDSTTAVRMCVDAMERCMQAGGGSAVASASSVQQGWRDVHGVAAHISYNTDFTYKSWGLELLGLPQPPGFP